MSWAKPSLLSNTHPLYPWIILQNVILPTVLAIFSTMVTIVADDSIQGGLAIDGALKPWITTLYLLAVNCTVPIANWFAEKYGYKLIYFLAVLIFTLGSFLSGCAEGFWALAAARFIEGIGAGLIFPVGMAIIVHAFPKERLSLAINLYMGLGFGLGIAFGVLLSGYIAMYEGWRWLFFLSLPNGLLALFIVWLFYEETEKKEVPRFDIGGFLSFITFISFLLIALTNGNLKSNAGGWTSPFILSCFGLAALGLILTLWIEMHTKHPLIPLKLFKDPLFSTGCLTLFAIGISLFASATLIVEYLEHGLFYDKSRTGLVSMSYGLAIGLFSVLANALGKKVSPFWLSLLGLAAIIFSYFLNNILSFQSGKIAVTSILIFRGMGIGLTLGPVTAQSLRHIPKELAGEAATLLTFFRQVGGTYGGAVLGILLIRRQIFHNLRFAEPVNPDLPGYQHTIQKMITYITQHAGSSPELASRQAREIIMQNIQTQSLIQSINDSLIAFAYVTIGVALLLVFFHLKKVLYTKT